MTVLNGLGVVLVAGGLALAACEAWRYIALRRALRRQLRDWRAIAAPRGFEIDARRDDIAMRGTVAGRSFVLDSHNFLEYGMDAEPGLRFAVEDEDATFSLSPWEVARNYGEAQGPVGDEEFDAQIRVRANAHGSRYLERLGPDERRLLVRFPGVALFQARGQAWIRLPYRFQAEHVDAACQLLASLWGSPPGSTEPRHDPM